MLKIYAIPISLYCAKLRILLRHKNLQWQELEPPGGYGSSEYKLTIPSGNLPALIDGELVLADSEAIAEYLNEKQPEPAMLPLDISQRGKIRQLSRFHDTRLEPELRLMFPHINPQKRNREKLIIQSDKIAQRLYQLANMVDGISTEYLDDGELMLADCGYPVSFEWINQLTALLDLQIEWPERVLAYHERSLRQPAISAELAAYRPRLAQFLISSVAT